MLTLKSSQGVHDASEGGAQEYQGGERGGGAPAESKEKLTRRHSQKHAQELEKTRRESFILRLDRKSVV